MSAAEAMPHELWANIVNACAGHLKLSHCFDDAMLDKTRRDSPDGAQCVVLEMSLNKKQNVDFRVVYSSFSLQQAVQTDSGSILSGGGLAFLGAGPHDLDEACNKEAWNELADNYMQFLHERPMPNPKNVLMLSSTSTGDLFWTLLDVIPAVFAGTMYLVHVVTELKTIVPFVLTKNISGAHGVCTEFLRKTRQELRNLSRSKDAAKDAGVFHHIAQQASDKLTDRLQDCEVGHHFVPRMGQPVVTVPPQQLWEQVTRDLGEELTNYFEVEPNQHESALTGDDPSGVACFLFDPVDIGSPMVCASKAFEDLSGRRSSWLRGRNWRFFQLHDAKQNTTYNGEELVRIQEFCKEPQRRALVSLLRVEGKDGPLWSIAIMRHVKIATGQLVFCGFKPFLPGQRDCMDHVLNHEDWSEESAEALRSLRLVVNEKVSTISGSNTLTLILGAVFLEWLQKAGTGIGDYWEGGHYVPKVGDSAVHEFVGKWPALVDTMKSNMTSLFQLQGRAIGSLREQVDSDIVCAVSDPRGIDCPLVFVSKSFEDMTGYTASYCLGRNCRFLQPNLPDLNKKVNGDELMRMREFCCKVHPPGHSIINLLLNERRTGERFWNMLYMTHVYVEEHHYILGVQSVLRLPMPSKISTQEATIAMLDHNEIDLLVFLESLGAKIEVLRAALREKGFAKLAKTAKKVSDQIRNWMKNASDEYEGDHLVPRAGMKQVLIYESDITWKRTFSSIQARLWEVYNIKSFGNGSDVDAQRVCCALADPAGDDCPLVYISREFEQLTGYVRDWALGRNCRFLQPNNRDVNKLLNAEEVKRMRPFCTDWQRFGTQIVVILINESSNSFPFLNLLIMEYIKVSERSYIFAIQTNLDKHLHKLVEMLAMCKTGLEELHRLRLLMQDSFEVLAGRNIRDVATEKLNQFVKQMPVQLLPLETKDTGEALVSLQLSTTRDVFEEMSSALCAGIRHFTVAFTLSDMPSGDVNLALMEGRLRAMQIGNALHNLKKRFLHYLRSAIKFTLVLPAMLIGCYAEIRHAIVSSGYIVDGWMLDVRGMQAAKMESSWKTMSHAKQQNEVEWIGLWGCGRQVPDLIAKCSSVEKVSICAFDVASFLDLEAKVLESLRTRSVGLMFFNVFGPKQAFLTDQNVKIGAGSMGVSPATLALKWAENQGARIVMPHLPDGYDAESKRSAGASKGQQHGEDIQTQGDSSSDDEDVGPVEVGSEHVEMHRKFVTSYRNAPDAATCAHAMATALAGMGRLSNLVSAQHLDDATALRGKIARRHSSVGAGPHETEHLDDATQSPTSARRKQAAGGKSADEGKRRPSFERRHSVAGSGPRETEHLEDATKSPTSARPRQAVGGKSADEGKRRPSFERRHSVAGAGPLKTQHEQDASKIIKRAPHGKSTKGSMLDEGLNKKPKFGRRHSVAGGGSLEADELQASRFARQVSDGFARQVSDASSNGTARKTARLATCPVPDMQDLAPPLAVTPIRRRRSVAGAAEAPIDGMSPRSISGELDRGTSQPRPLFTRRKSLERRCSKDLALSALRLSAGENPKCRFCATRADGELPEMVEQITKRLLTKGMAIEEVAEIIGVGQEVIEKVAHKTAEATRGDGDDKTTEPAAGPGDSAADAGASMVAVAPPPPSTPLPPSTLPPPATVVTGEAEAIIDNITTGGNEDTVEDTLNEGAGDSLGEEAARDALGNGDGKTTAPEAEAITGNITTATDEAPIEDTISESAADSLGESADKTFEKTSRANQCVVGG